MEIKTQPYSVTVTFSPDKYWLKASDQDWAGTHMLVHRIDMSYKGKDDQEGAPVLYLMNEAAADVFRQAGFSEIL
jgi:hypothetical protein